MNNFKKIGLSALAGSLVATSSFAGEMTVTGSASLGLEHINGGAANAGKSFSMGNQLTFTGGGELDNGLNVSLSYVIDQGDDENQARISIWFSLSDNQFRWSWIIKILRWRRKLSCICYRWYCCWWYLGCFDIASTVHPTGVGGGSNSMFYTFLQWLMV